MPQFIRAVGYKIYFWSNEKGEPIHFHATKGTPDDNDSNAGFFLFFFHKINYLFIK